MKLMGGYSFLNTQWYVQIHAYHPEFDSARMMNINSENPTVKITAPADGDTLSQSAGKYTLKAEATDGPNGSGIFKVEFYLDQIDADQKK